MADDTILGGYDVIWLMRHSRNMFELILAIYHCAQIRSKSTINITPTLTLVFDELQHYFDVDVVTDLCVYIPNTAEIVVLGYLSDPIDSHAFEPYFFRSKRSFEDSAQANSVDKYHRSLVTQDNSQV